MVMAPCEAVPLKPSHSRGSTRPTSAGSLRETSQNLSRSRPLSAGSGQDAPRFVLHESVAQVDGSDVWPELPSRPTSAGYSRPTSAGYSYSVTRRSSASISARGDSPNHAATLAREPEPHSLEQMIIGSPDFGRRTLEEELREPVLTPIPSTLATPLEKQIGTAIGLKGKGRQVPRLPRDVVSCKHGSTCCWRWLARAALEEVAGTSLASMSLAEGVAQIKEEQGWGRGGMAADTTKDMPPCLQTGFTKRPLKIQSQGPEIGNAVE